MAPDRFRRPVWLWLVPILSLALTGVAWHVTRVSTAARAADRFKFRTSMIRAVIEQRLESHISVLRGVVGLFDASGNVPAEEWERYLQAVHPESTPGLQGVGFSAHTPRAERSAFTVLYVHPTTNENLRALGSDVFTEPVRHEAMTRARDQGMPALSGQVRLVQEGAASAQPGFVMLLPVYAPGRPTSSVDERRAALRGVVSGAFRARDLMDSIFGGQHWDVDFEIYDGAVPSGPGLVYRSAPDGPAVADTANSDVLSQRLRLDIGGHRWLLIARPAVSFMSFSDRYQYWLIAGGGIAINLLLAAGFWASATVRRRAVVMAEGMSQAVRVGEAQTQLMVDSITDHAIFRLDSERNVASWNASAERMLGYSEAEAISRPAARFWVVVEWIPTELRSAVDDVLQLLRPRAFEKGLELSVEYAPGIPDGIETDPGRLRQVLTNLVANAVKFTSAGRVRILVDMDKVSAKLRFRIVDTRPGIPADSQKHLFQPFTQLDVSTTRRYGGTGLGLAICKQLVDLLGGEIGVISPATDHSTEGGPGSIFWFSLPATVATGAMRTAPRHAIAAPAADRSNRSSLCRVLVAEDNSVNQMVIRAMLQKLGIEATLVADGRKAVEAVAETPFDLVLMDCQMPVMDGFEATQIIRSGSLSRPVIVAVTANAMAGDAERCRAAGMDDYISKPIMFESCAGSSRRGSMRPMPSVPARPVRPTPDTPAIDEVTVGERPQFTTRHSEGVGAQ